MGRIVFDYLWLTILIAVVFAVLTYFFSDLGGSSGAVTTVVAAMSTGQLYGQRTGQEVSSGFAWKVAAVLTVVSLLFSGVVVAILHMVGVPLVPPEIELTAGVVVAILAISGLIALLVTRFVFSWGVKQGAKITAAKKKKDNEEIFD